MIVSRPSHRPPFSAAAIGPQRARAPKRDRGRNRAPLFVHCITTRKRFRPVTHGRPESGQNARSPDHSRGARAYFRARNSGLKGRIWPGVRSLTGMLRKCSRRVELKLLRRPCVACHLLRHGLRHGRAADIAPCKPSKSSPWLRF